MVGPPSPPRSPASGFPRRSDGRRWGRGRSGGGRREMVPDGLAAGGVTGAKAGGAEGGKSPWVPGRQDRLHAVGTSFYNGGPGKFLPVRSAWRRAWVSRRRARVGANSVKRSAACGPASAIARVDDGFRRRVSFLIFRFWGADSGPPAGITVWDHFWAPVRPLRPRVPPRSINDESTIESGPPGGRSCPGFSPPAPHDPQGCRSRPVIGAITASRFPCRAQPVG